MRKFYYRLSLFELTLEAYRQHQGIIETTEVFGHCTMLPHEGAMFATLEERLRKENLHG